MKKTPYLLTKETKKHWVAACIFFAAAFLLCVHYDLRETAAHAYQLLDSLFSGQPRSFYADVIAHENPYGYVNNAHYNVAFYSVFALFELPVFLVCRLLGTFPAEWLLTLVAKLVCAAFYGGCILLMPVLGRRMGLSDRDASWAALFFALWPPAFFATFVMGQYDVICLFLLLAGFLCWNEGWMLPFSFLFGAAFTAKSFPVLLFIPLLLLREKRPTRLLLYGAVSLWLLAPVGLLYRGLTFDAALFGSDMTQRLFATRLMGGREIPLFALLWCLGCVLCWFWRPAKEALGRCGLYTGLCAFGLLFLLVEWHPQWLILLAPFAVLTTFLEKQRAPWFFLDMVLCAGFFLVSFAAFPMAMEGTLFEYGLFGLLTGFTYPGPSVMDRATLALPVLGYIPTALFGAALAAHVALKMPLAGGSPASRLVGKAPFTTLAESRQLPVFLWTVFGVGMACWLLPTLWAILF